MFSKKTLAVTPISVSYYQSSYAISLLSLISGYLGCCSLVRGNIRSRYKIDAGEMLPRAVVPFLNYSHGSSWKCLRRRVGHLSWATTYVYRNGTLASHRRIRSTTMADSGLANGYTNSCKPLGFVSLVYTISNSILIVLNDQMWH